ncbi:hypothetical protein RDABS01_009989, partial [Bienertia sinuspersici]
MSIPKGACVRKDKKRKKLFRFEELWLRDEGCEEVVRRSWRMGENVKCNIAFVAANLQSWGKATFGNTAKEIRDDLIENGTWNWSVAHRFLNARELNLLRDFHLPCFPCDDMWAWKGSKDGNFSVKSAYYMAVGEYTKGSPSSSKCGEQVVWKKIWRANIPPKVRNFAWRFVHNATPVNTNLEKKGVEIDITCKRCGEAKEDVTHLILSCCESRKIWYLSPLRLDVVLRDGMSLWDWIIEMLQKITEVEWWDLFWEICWSIWLDRNNRIFTKVKRNCEWWISKAVGAVGEYRKAVEASKSGGLVAVRSREKWGRPPAGHFKLNTDAALRDNGRVGLGAVLRDSEGDVLVAVCDTVNGVSEVEVAEALALRRAVQIVMEAGFHSFSIEVDCLVLANAVLKKREVRSTFGLVVKDVCRLLDSCGTASICHVRRGANKVAHGLAKESLEIGELRVWLEEVPE